MYIYEKAYVCVYICISKYCMTNKRVYATFSVSNNQALIDTTNRKHIQHILYKKKHKNIKQKKCKTKYKQLHQSWPAISLIESALNLPLLFICLKRCPCVIGEQSNFVVVVIVIVVAVIVDIAIISAHSSTS